MLVGTRCRWGLEFDTAYQLGEPLIGMQIAQCWVDFKQGHGSRAIFISFFKPFKGLVFLVQACINQCDRIGWNVVSTRTTLQEVEQLPWPVYVSCDRIGVSQGSLIGRVATGESHRRLKFGNSF